MSRNAETCVIFFPALVLGTYVRVFPRSACFKRLDLVMHTYLYLYLHATPSSSSGRPPSKVECGSVVCGVVWGGKSAKYRYVLT